MRRQRLSDRSRRTAATQPARADWAGVGRSAGLGPIEAAQTLYHAPFFVASHDCADNPLLTYGNRVAQQLFEMTWDEFTQTPSRLTAEEPNRAERAQLLERVTRRGFIDDYCGIRISKTGRRFRIASATVWKLYDREGTRVGQAASFSEWDYL